MYTSMYVSHIIHCLSDVSWLKYPGFANNAQTLQSPTSRTDAALPSPAWHNAAAFHAGSPPLGYLKSNLKTTILHFIHLFTLLSPKTVIFLNINSLWIQPPCCRGKWKTINYLSSSPKTHFNIKYST